ncbi:MAG: Lipopolysaccharide assembly protein A [Gammaproteobacteria bacterium]|nr:Lipopolysaccharide assembly protein A [Gammaproteobacteria bacterium]
MQRIVALLRLLAIVVIILSGLVLHTRNAQPVTLDLYFVRIEQPLSLILAVSLLIGAVLGVLGALPRLLAGRRANRRLRRELRAHAMLPAAPPTDAADKGPA